MRRLISLVALIALCGCSSPEEKAQSLYEKALTMERESKFAESVEALESVTKDYPDTEAARQAKDYLSAKKAIGFPLTKEELAQESAAVANLRTINTAEVTYLSTAGGSYGDIGALISAGLIDGRFVSDISGYKFTITASEGDYTATAAPTKNPAGRYFYSSPDGVVRYEVGKPAQAGSPEVR
jgi:hypothetical protein